MCVYVHVKKCVRFNRREREEIRIVFITVGNVEDYSEKEKCSLLCDRTPHTKCLPKQATSQMHVFKNTEIIRSHS